jgi:hypothetical protein
MAAMVIMVMEMATVKTETEKTTVTEKADRTSRD